MSKWQADNHENMKRKLIVLRYYKYVPKHTYVSATEGHPSSGSKDCKERITLLACANAAGTCKIRLTVIGRSRNPQSFRNVKVFPVSYRANKTAWVTQELFIDWFDSEFVPKARAHCQSVGLPPDCKIILFLDNCTAHPPVDLLKQNNVMVEYLPPNCTSLIQPLDQGVLRSLKCKYKMHFLKNLLDASYENKLLQQFIKEFTIKDGIWLAARAWEEVSKETLIHAWHNLMPTSIFLEEDSGPDDFEGFQISEEKLLHQELKEYAENALQSDLLTEDDIDDCFDVDSDVPVSYQLSDAEIVQMVLNPENNENEESESADEIPEEKISNQRCIQLIQELIKGMEQKTFINQTQIMDMYNIQKLFLQQKVNFQQKKIDDLLNK